MAASIPERFLEVGGDDRRIALTFYWGQVLEAFSQDVLFYDNTGSIIAFKNITEGKSWEFPFIGDGPDPEYHTEGAELLGQAIATNVGSITIDDMLVDHVDVPETHEIMSHFDVLAPFGRRLGEKLAQVVDANIAQTAVLAARTAAVANIHSGGNRVGRNAAFATAYPASAAGAANFIDDVAYLAQLMDEDYIPRAGRYLFIPPYIRRILRFDTSIFNRDYNPATQNVLNKRIVGELEGFEVVVSNSVPSTNVTTGLSKYQGNFSVTQVAAETYGRPAAIALCGAQQGTPAVGFVQAGGIVPIMEPDNRRGTTFLKAKFMGGAGVLAPWAAGEIYAYS
ncbi:MAG TPA: hypothetical protein VMW48_06105 [Vicinamibacterales bacterium]|nr:hypothetical protein [Vicinamibacterales bacterium]